MNQFKFNRIKLSEPKLERIQVVFVYLPPVKGKKKLS